MPTNRFMPTNGYFSRRRRFRACAFFRSANSAALSLIRWLASSFDSAVISHSGCVFIGCVPLTRCVITYPGLYQFAPDSPDKGRGASSSNPNGRGFEGRASGCCDWGCGAGCWVWLAMT